MNFLRSTYFKKASAAVCIGLFIFIYALKALHSHELSVHSSTASLYKNGTVVKTNFSCSICDFQLAKDSDIIINILHIAVPVYYIHTHFNFTNTAFNSLALPSNGRAPPTIA